MNFKDLLLPLTLAMLTTWGVHYFFFNKTTTSDEEVRSGQSFIAPKAKKELNPLNSEVNFSDVKRPKPSLLSEVQTDGAVLVFTTDGATLESLTFKHVYNCPGCPMQTIEMPAETEKENRAFLLALGNETPYYYDLINRQDLDDKIQLTYQADFQDGRIEKKFTVYKDSYKIDLAIKVESKKAQEEKLEPRIFFPSPSVPALKTNDAIFAIMSNEKSSIEKISTDKLNVEQGWFAPRIFGADDRYFVHALVDDQQSFVQRGYFKFSDKNKLVAILEGPAVGKTPTNEWKLSFYCGPKEVASFAKVDARLEQTLDYSGIFSPISKFLLYVLKLLYSYLKNYGLAIIALTILVKLVLLPFTYRAEEGMQKRAEFDKKLKYVQQKFKHDPEMLAHERAELIKKHGMPGLSGCLPLLLQLPIFIALSRVLSSAIELYRAPFFGWIHDLSASDPYYVLPVITGLGMLMQTATMAGNDPKQKIPSVVMALVIGAVTANLAAGLALYICTFNILGIVQTKALKFFKRS